MCGAKNGKLFHLLCLYSKEKEEIRIGKNRKEEKRSQSKSLKCLFQNIILESPILWPPLNVGAVPFSVCDKI